MAELLEFVFETVIEFAFSILIETFAEKPRVD
jgi:hypothetical protein